MDHPITDFDVSCQEIIVTSEKVKIRNSSSKKIVKKRQDSLIEKLGKSEILDDYLQRRIFSLSSNQVKIIVPEKSSQQKFSEIEELDRALRCSRSIMKFGIIKIPTSDDFFDSGTYIASSIYTGLILGYKFSKQLFNIDKCIVIDD